MLSVWLVLVSCMDFLLYSSAEEGLEFPSFDGKDRVLNVNERNYKKALKKYDMMCLLFHEPLPSEKDLQQQFHMREMVLELGKSHCLTHSILTESCDLCPLGLEEEGSIYVFKDERVIEFDGELSADTLVEFLLDVSEICDPVELISNPMEQRAFERMDEDIRLIGYFKGENSEREWLFCLPIYSACKIMILRLSQGEPKGQRAKVESRARRPECKQVDGGTDGGTEGLKGYSRDRARELARFNRG
uniref:Calsequestrin n=1 Tax=Sinocyclocheilus grahami TaxID=75366 RepID=A0A672SEK5_SINGR